MCTGTPRPIFSAVQNAGRCHKNSRTLARRPCSTNDRSGSRRQSRGAKHKVAHRIGRTAKRSSVRTQRDPRSVSYTTRKRVFAVQARHVADRFAQTLDAQAARSGCGERCLRPRNGCSHWTKAWATRRRRGRLSLWRGPSCHLGGDISESSNGTQTRPRSECTGPQDFTAKHSPAERPVSLRMRGSAVRLARRCPVIAYAPEPAPDIAQAVKADLGGLRVHPVRHSQISPTSGPLQGLGGTLCGSDMAVVNITSYGHHESIEVDSCDTVIGYQSVQSLCDSVILLIHVLRASLQDPRLVPLWPLDLLRM